MFWHSRKFHSARWVGHRAGSIECLEIIKTLHLHLCGTRHRTSRIIRTTHITQRQPGSQSGVVIQFHPSSNQAVISNRSSMERVMGIEPTSSAWEAEVIPLYDTRLIRRFYLNTSDGSPVVVDSNLRMEMRGLTSFFYLLRRTMGS